MRSYLLATALFAPSLLVAQRVPADVARERAERIHWIGQDPLSPARAITIAPITPTGTTLGSAGSDITLPGAPLATVRESNGRVTLTGWGAEQVLPVGRPTAARGVRLVPLGTPGRIQLVVYQDDKPGKRPLYYPYLASARQTVTLTATTPKPQRILAPDGTSADATEIGTVTISVAGSTATLRVMRLQLSEEESELLINFRDATTGKGTYPAGRFVELIPTGHDRYTLDLNRAFNPNCAYSNAFPCPFPWTGNEFAGKVEAGEKYPPGALTR
jgi:hypothetical protein